MKTSSRLGSNIPNSSGRYLVQGVLDFELKSSGAPSKFGCFEGPEDFKLWG